MADLDADIARIAAMRGRPAANYVAEAREQVTASRRIHSSEVRALFRMPDDRRAEFRAYDALPARSRLVLSELPICASATKYADLLLRMEDEASLIDAVRDQLPGVVRDWVLDQYGRDHPTARRLP